MSIAAVSFTAAGAGVCARLCRDLEDCTGYAPARHTTGSLQPLEHPVGEWAALHFTGADALIFVGAAGIAVRAIAPLLHSKLEDPAVLCVDETARFVIPLLSGHIGGANALAAKVAQLLDATPVITTATDLAGVFAFDQWVACNGCVVAAASEIKHISGALLEGETVGLEADFPIQGGLPAGVKEDCPARCGVLLSAQMKKPFAHTLHIVPPCVVVGIGCRKNIDYKTLRRAFESFLAAGNLHIKSVAALASIDLKAREPALLQLSEALGVPLYTYSAAELAAAPGEFDESPFVEQVTGVGNVCQRAAALAGGTPLLPKTIGEGTAFAASLLEWRISF